MRFLRLDFGDDLYSLDLHPLVTVVSGLSSQHQRQLFNSVRRFATGSTVGVRGLVEHGGLLVELDGQAKDRLATVATTSDVVIYVDGADSANQLVGLQAEIDQWERQAAIDAVIVEEIRADLNPSLKATVAALRRTLDPMNLSDGDLEDASIQQVRYAAARRAYDRVVATNRHVDRVDPVVADLLEQWDHYQLRREENGDHLTRLETDVARARETVEKAEVRLQQAEQAAKPVLLSSAEEARLETLSELDSSGGKGWRRKGLTVEEQAEKQALLDKVGVASWTEYSVFRMSPTASPEKAKAVADATKEYELARERLQRVEETAASDETYVELDVALAQIRKEARDVLGAVVPKDIGSALRGLINQVENPEWVVSLNDLRDVLASNDLRPPYGYEPDEILGWTSSWLEAEARLQDSSGDTGNGHSAEELDGLRQELAGAEQLLLRHRRALVRIERAEQAAQASSDRLERLRLQLVERSTRSVPTSADDIVALVQPAVSRVTSDAGCSLPIIVAGSMNGLDGREMEILMTELESLAQKVQIIVATNRPEAFTWANEVGLRRADLANGARSAA
ncbi:MAG: hypothetical protein OER95_03010 [Acidimicrobiia bacterium]|nr:hypothetical protein [Acidimicrobiia bacterium]